jgi:hypothetical protein
MTAFWNRALCSPIEVYRRFSAYCLHYQGGAHSHLHDDGGSTHL